MAVAQGADGAEEKAGAEEEAEAPADEAQKDGGAEAGAKEIHRGWWGIYTTGFITYYLPPLLWL